MAIKGNAGFKYTPPTESEVTYAIAYPLRLSISLARLKNRTTSDTLDLSGHEVVSIGNGRDEMQATLRFEPDPVGLLELLTYGADGVTLTYFPDLAETEESYDLWLISPTSSEIAPDPERRLKGEWAVRARFRDASEDGQELSTLHAVAP